MPLRSKIAPKSRIAWLLLAGLLVMAGWQHAAAGVFNPSTITLANGLQVVVIENHRAPVVTHMIWYRVSGSDDCVYGFYA